MYICKYGKNLLKRYFDFIQPVFRIIHPVFIKKELDIYNNDFI